MAIVAAVVFGDTDYPVSAAVAKANEGRVRACALQAYWKDSPFAVCGVEELSGVRRTPDVFPADGDFTSPLRVIAARGEFEGVSFLVFPFADLDGVQFAPTEFRCGTSVLPAASVDLKTVKVWYQQGTAWCGFHADHLNRVATPELLLHDEALVEVDHRRKENYLRCEYAPGRSEYRWISFTPAQCGFSKAAGTTFVCNSWVSDAPSLRPVRLQRQAFRQFVATFHIPADAQPGLYDGAITAAVGGKEVCRIPVELRVLPFELPRPRTFYDPEREFLGCAYVYRGLAVDESGIGRNFAEHNVLNPHLRVPTSDEDARRMVETVRETGLSDRLLSKALPYAGWPLSYPPQETDKHWLEFVDSARTLTNALVRLRRYAGEEAEIFAFGCDEADAEGVRRERWNWQTWQSLGAKVFATTHFHRYLLFCLDFANVPIQPSAPRKELVDAWHAANPGMRIAWYADPHSGPENPAFARRLYGWTTWRNDYDGFYQYIAFNNYWTEFWCARESNLRGLVLCYPQRDGVLDTLQWEGLREGVDDVRYGTLLRQLAARARASKDISTVYAARAASTWVAQVDAQRSSLESLRLECIARILDLSDRLGKEGTK